MTGLSLRDLRVNTTIPQSIVMQVRKLKRAAVYVGDKRIDATKITIFPEAATALQHLSSTPRPASRCA